jgi:hypothetical protein
VKSSQNTSARPRLPFSGDRVLEKTLHIAHFYKWKANAIPGITAIINHIFKQKILA